MQSQTSVRLSLVALGSLMLAFAGGCGDGSAELPPGSGGTTSGDVTGGASSGGTGTGGTSGGNDTGGVSSGGTGASGGTESGGTGSGGASSGGSGTGGAGSGGEAGTGGGPSITGATPPMGWNSWNAYGCNVSEAVVKSMADAMVSTGMKDAGYEYINIDDCWMDGRDAQGKLKANTAGNKFPSGIAALADYVHDKGLKIGIYQTPNTKTCAAIYGGYTGGVGSLGHEAVDAQTFADWGIDYLKYDKCQGPLSGFAVMRDALKATGRPIFYSINPGDQGPYCTPQHCSLDLPSIANMWRIEFDITATWASVIGLIDANKEEYIGAGPGHWNDPDMLEVGNGLNDKEGRAHFSMWAIMAAPLITGNDLTKMSATTLETLTNLEVIAVNQDALGQQGRVVATPGPNLEVWSKELSAPKTRAVALFNRGGGSANITVNWSDLGLSGPATVRDLWAKQDLGSFTGSYTANNVPSHSVVMLKIVGP